jgi:hypothetical protein
MGDVKELRPVPLKVLFGDPRMRGNRLGRSWEPWTTWGIRHVAMAPYHPTEAGHRGSDGDERTGPEGRPGLRPGTD